MTNDESLDAHHRAEEVAEAAAQALQAGPPGPSPCCAAHQHISHHRDWILVLVRYFGPVGDIGAIFRGNQAMAYSTRYRQLESATLAACCQ